MEESILIQISKENLKTMLAEVVEEAVTKIVPKEKRYYSRQQISEKFKVSLPTVHGWINSGKLIALKIGGRTLFDADEVDNAIKEKRVLKFKHIRR